MSSQYKENNFSTENRSASHTITQNNKDKITKPNIDHLIKRILVERRRKKRVKDSEELEKNEKAEKRKTCNF